MSRADKIAKMATRTASQAKEAATMSKKKTRAKNGVSFESHKHCVICSIPIAISNEPAICHNSDCHVNQKRKEASRKKLTFVLYAGVAMFFVTLVAGALS
jgi:predicted nucleic acid-binding Zn ribbon protein